MKRTFTTIAFAAGIVVAGYAQSNNSSNNNNSATSAQAIQELRDCLDSKDVSYTLVPSMSGSTLYLYVAPGTPYGKVNSCMQHYSNARTSGPGFPEIIQASAFDF